MGVLYDIVNPIKLQMIGNLYKEEDKARKEFEKNLLKRAPVSVQAGDVTSLLKRKKKRGRGATITGPGTKMPGLLSLLSNSRKTLLG